VIGKSGRKIESGRKREIESGRKIEIERERIKSYCILE